MKEMKRSRLFLSEGHESGKIFRLHLASIRKEVTIHIIRTKKKNSNKSLLLIGHIFCPYILPHITEEIITKGLNEKKVMMRWRSPSLTRNLCMQKKRKQTNK